MKFNELSDKIKEKVLDKYRDINVDHEWYDFTVDNLQKELEDEYGFSNVKISFSGFASQGDGASFTGRIIDFQTFVKKTEIDPSIRFERNDHRYSHKNTVSVDYEDLERSIDEWRSEKCSEIYKTLEAEYDYLTSDEQVAESIDANQFEFDEEGKRL